MEIAAIDRGLRMAHSLVIVGHVSDKALVSFDFFHRLDKDNSGHGGALHGSEDVQKLD